ncbi:c-type cytochrome [Empedobacter brevis]
MKKLTLIMTVLVSLSSYSCHKTENSKTAEPEIDYSTVDIGKPVEATKPTELTNAEKGKGLVEKADCLSCHAVNSKLIGPSYHDVAGKYTTADRDVLASKIIEGGKGNWGDVPMTPHPTISKDEASQMVDYILSLKK